MSVEADVQDRPTTTRTITVDATAQREAIPELAAVNVTVTGGGESVAAVRGTARDRAATMRESVTTVPADAIRTVDRRVRESEELFEGEADAPYSASERLRIRCTPETTAAVVVVTDAGGAVQSVEFRLHDEVRRRLQDEALAAAMGRARERAERIGSVEGLTVTQVQNVTTKDADTAPGGLVEEALAMGDESNLHPSPITVSETVEVVYELVGE